MKHLLTDVPIYKKQKQAAKRLFREMQLEEVSHIVPLLPNKVVFHYRPVEEDIFLKIKLFLEKFKKQIGKFFNFSKKRRVCVVKSKTVYQLHVWERLRKQLQISLENILKGKEVENIQKLLRPLELDSFLCLEQAIQIAYLEALRHFDMSQLHALEKYAESFDVDKPCVPRFLFELKRALQWTFELRKEWSLIQQKKRKEPAEPLEGNAELVFK